MKKCNCIHVGHCPFRPDPLVMVNMEGEPLFRGLDEQEQLKARVMVEGQNLNDPEPGDFVGTDQQGTVTILGRAVDPEAAITYTKSKLGTKCKANSFMWRKRHPAPKK
jgi:hypothetical protein